MSRIEKIQKILEEIEIIERIIRPYEFYTPDVSWGLGFLATIKDDLRDPEIADLKWVLERFREAENVADLYRGYEPADEAMRHIAEIKKIVGDG